MINRIAAIGMSVLIISPKAPPAPAVRMVTVEAVDYAFRAPTSVPAGRIAFRLANRGKMLHEMQFIHFRGLTADSVNKLISKEPTGAPPRDFSMSVLISAPGNSSDQEVLVTGRKGDIYGLICQFQDADNKPKHRDMGMFTLIQVK